MVHGLSWRAMTLKLRPAGLASGIDKDRFI
jgi:hypothetical protein